MSALFIGLKYVGLKYVGLKYVGLKDVSLKDVSLQDVVVPLLGLFWNFGKDSNPQSQNNFNKKVTRFLCLLLLSAFGRSCSQRRGRDSNPQPWVCLSNMTTS